MNLEVQRIIETSLSDLLLAVTARKNEGCRLVAITATTNGNRYELCYSFDKLYRVQTHRVTIPKGDSLPSITGMYPSAFVYENELHDIFGIAIAGSQAASRDGRPCKRFTYPFEFSEVPWSLDEEKRSSGHFDVTIPHGDTLCRNR
jgi:ech hydrogenase subunit D